MDGLSLVQVEGEGSGARGFLKKREREWKRKYLDFKETRGKGETREMKRCLNVGKEKM